MKLGLPILGAALVLAALDTARANQAAGSPATTATEAMPPAEPEQAPNIRDDLVGRVTDGTDIPKWWNPDPAPEAKAYSAALIAADTTSAKAFAKSAQRDVTFAHLFEEPARYRGVVVHYEGRLKRVRRFPAHDYVREGYDILYIYEGWIFDLHTYGANPMCVVFTKLPPGVPVKDEVDMPASFDGYFFKKWRYLAGDGWRESPVLIGHTVVVDQAAAGNRDTGISFSQTMLAIFLALLLMTVALTVGLHWLYRRGDRRVRTRLGDAKPPPFLENQPAAEIDAVPEPDYGNGVPEDERTDWETRRYP